jgi:hypothetical protein
MASREGVKGNTDRDTKDRRNETRHTDGPRPRETAIVALFHPHGRELLRQDRGEEARAGVGGIIVGITMKPTGTMAEGLLDH